MTRVPAVKAILVHGNGGCSAGDISLPWLERQVTALGLDVTNQTFPDNIQARAAVRCRTLSHSVRMSTRS